MIPIPMAAALALAAAACSGLLAWNAQSWRYESRIANREAEIAKVARAYAEKARRQEQEWQRYVDEISKDAARRQQVLAGRAATTELVARGLRDDIAALNARPAPADPTAARHANDAARARELLGACAEEYRGVAVAADGLRDQVIGLQDYARTVSSGLPSRQD